VRVRIPPLSRRTSPTWQRQHVQAVSSLGSNPRCATSSEMVATLSDAVKELRRTGPYRGKHGHLFYTVHYDDGSKKSVFVHREMMEKHLGRKLRRDEFVHHKDLDSSHNVVKNFELQSPSAHSRLHGALKHPETMHFTCPQCGKRFVRLARHVRGNWKKGRSGPFCSRKCAGKAFATPERVTHLMASRQHLRATHGTNSKYCSGCRCIRCRRAHTETARLGRTSGRWRS
jgi:hypothetical protein